MLKTTIQRISLKEYIEERAVEISEYIIENNATVRQAAKQFGVSKSTVHTDVHKPNDLKPSLRLAKNYSDWAKYQNPTRF